jgi:hypothetical protein
VTSLILELVAFSVVLGITLEELSVLGFEGVSLDFRLSGSHMSFQ